LTPLPLPHTLQHSLLISFFFLMLRPPPRSTLFPYTTLFRSDPIFIVGLPRAGSTLLEQILASHSLVEGTMELPDVPRIANELNLRGLGGGKGFPETLAELDPGELHALGAGYLESTRVQRKTGAPFFIDKNPNNWLYLGLIQLMLPNARIIDARRHPLACGFSCFKQHSARGQSFTYDLEYLGRYYRD